MNRARRGGFTLIEVLVALAIVAIGMAAVLSALSSSASTVVYLRDKSFAQWVALNKIATLRLMGQQPATGATNGDVDYADRKWHWRQEVATTDAPGVVRIDVSVRPAEVKAGDDNGWVTTVSGIFGNSIGIGDGVHPPWGAQTLGLALTPNGQNGATPAPQPGPAGTGAPGTGTTGTGPTTTTTPGQPPPGSTP